MKFKTTTMVLAAGFFVFSVDTVLADASAKTKPASKHSASSSIEFVADRAFVAAVPASSKNTAGYFTLKNSSEKEIRLIGASSDVARTLELHQHLHVDGRMKMEQVESIVVPAKGEVVLKPKGLHLMLIGLEKDFAKKKSIGVKLQFSDGTSLDVTLPVRKPGEVDAAASSHEHSKGHNHHGHH